MKSRRLVCRYFKISVSRFPHRDTIEGEATLSPGNRTQGNDECGKLGEWIPYGTMRESRSRGGHSLVNAIGTSHQSYR